jgi:hypothetical protein
VAPSFEYIFARNMAIIQVKAQDPTGPIHDQLVREGKLTGKFDEAYLDNLKNEVRYWDGKEWRRERVMVSHNLQVTGGSPPK